jgi:type II secretion system protein N
VEEKAPISLPRPLRIAAIAFAALVLFTTFVYMGFPYDRLGPILVSRVEQASDLRVRVDGVSPSPQLLGPGIALEKLRVEFADGRVLDFSRVRVRLAWSTSWLMARPAFAIDAESPSGSVDGVVTLGQPSAFDGELSGIDLEAYDLAAYAQGLSLEGVADLDVDLSFGEAGSEGTLTLNARSGTLAHPSLPMTIPYEQIHGEFVLGGDAAVRIESLVIESSLGQGTIGGSVGHAAGGKGAPLDIQVEIAAAPAVQSVLRSQGVKLAKDGSATFRIAGTTGQPRVQ